MSTLLDRTQEIIEVASQADNHDGNSVIVLNRHGGMRMLDAAGWTLDGLITEFGAREVFRVEVRGGTIKVEGWSPSERCLLQRRSAASRFADLVDTKPAMHYYPARLCSA